MPKVNGPLFSLEARGTVGKAITFARRRGQDIVTVRPVPTQAYTVNQSNAKQVIAIGGEVSRRVFRDQVGRAMGNAMTPLMFLQSIVVAPNTWASTFNRFAFPSGTTTLTAEIAVYDALTDPQKATWVTWNTALDVSFETVAAFQGGTRTVAAEVVAFIFARGLARAGYLTTLPAGVPPTWDNTQIRAEGMLASARKRLHALSASSVRMGAGMPEPAGEGV